MGYSWTADRRELNRADRPRPRQTNGLVAAGRLGKTRAVMPLSSQLHRPCWLIALLFLAGASPWLHAQNESDRIALLQDQIQALDKVVAVTKNAGEKASLQAKLQRMQEEISILQEGQAIQQREQEIEQARSRSSLDILRDKLRLVDRTEDEAEAEVRSLGTQREQVAADRGAVAAELDSLRSQSQPDAARISELEEQIFTKNEKLRELALRREAAEAESDLARDADRLRDQLKSFEMTGRPNLRLIFESYTQLREQQKSDDQVSAISADLEQNLKLGQASLELAQQKLAKFDQELSVLEKQTGFFHRDLKVEEFLASERIQKQALADRLPIAIAQVDAIKAAQEAVQARQELNALGSAVQKEQFVALKDAYLKRLRWPAVALSALLLLHLILSYTVLPIFYRHEGLFLARRLSRYLFILAGTLVLSGFLFDDLSMVAATLGIVSAALVIALQDVCTSVCGWFVIMAGGKFRIGNRLEIDGLRGDVLDIQLLRTTLHEVGGWLGVDQPTGRVILVPNNVIFKSKIFNFAHGHPYIWGKLDITITFSTPLSQAMALFRRILEEESRETMAEARRASGVMQKRYGIEDAVYEPKIYTTIADSGVVYTLFFVAHYRQFPAMRARLSHRILAELEHHPEIQLAYPSVTVFRPDAHPPAAPAVK
jgi:small-conductance mechanosensitive channel